MKNQLKYSLAFTAASLRLNEMVLAAKAIIEHSITDYSELTEDHVDFNTAKAETSRRSFREIRNRLIQLTPNQIEMLANGSLIQQKQIAFLAVCKHYLFIKDFVVEVLWDKTMVFNYQINESDFNSFINRKIPLQPELETFSESTLKKAKQVLFLILEQAGIINNTKDKTIQAQLLQPSVMKIIAADDPQYLRIFMIPDQDINQIKC
jgi:hypothetical protein